jgi:phage-related protein
MGLTFEHFKDNDGNDLINLEFDRLQKTDRIRILAKLYDIKTNGLSPKNHKIFAGYTIPFGEFISGDFRMLMHQTGDASFLLLHVFRKQTNHTPAKEIEVAWKRLMFYLSRQHYGNP